MAKRKKARKHSVKAELSVHELSKAGTSLRLKIYADAEKLGEIEIGRGAIYWYGANRQKAKRIDWSSFARQMDELAYG